MIESARAYTAGMLDRAACERRVYRLATLLTGNPNAATNVIAQVIDAQPDLRRLDGAHLDRLTVLRSREIPPATLADDRVPPSAAQALATLTPQQREAWVFARVYQIPQREMAKAMDCSVTAAQRHLEQADDLFRRETPHGVNPVKALLAYSMSLDVPAFYRVERLRRRRMKKAMIWFALLLAAAAVGAVVMWWSRPLNPL